MAQRNDIKYFSADFPLNTPLKAARDHEKSGKQAVLNYEALREAIFYKPSVYTSLFFFFTKQQP